MEEDLEPIKLSKAAHKPKCLCTVDVVLHPTVEDTPKGSKENKKNPRLHSKHPWTLFEWWRSRTHTTQLERREEEEGEANLSRFGGCELICFKSVTGGSNMLGFAPNLVSSFYT